MQITHLKHEEIKLVGCTARTSNAAELQGNGKIMATVDHYFKHQIAVQIKTRVRPGVTYCAYTDYESDETGEYTYFIGEEVKSLEGQCKTLQDLVVPAQTYAKLTAGPGAMPAVCIDAWKDIWSMSRSDLGGKRSYLTDFELYDERAQDQQSTILDIYLGLEGGAVGIDS